MKQCSKCGLEKSLEEFSKKTATKYRSHCLECQRLHMRNWYAKNRDTHIQDIYDRKKATIKANWQTVIAYLLAHPCVDCDERDIRVLEFDHLRDKHRNISKMLGEGYSPKTLMKEIAKCDVRCANCHKRKTGIEQGHFKARYIASGSI